MKTKFFMPLLVVAAIFTGCSSGTKDEPAYRSSADTTSSSVITPSSDSIIKDTAMKDSVNTADNPVPASKTNSADKNGTGNP